MSADVLTCDHRRARRHAHRVLVVGTPVDDPARGERVDHRGTGDTAAGTAEGVVSLLVGRDEQDLSAHVSLPFRRATGADELDDHVRELLAAVLL